jgi:general secretion pathway protein F
MVTVRYKAYSAQNEIKEGTIAAGSREAAIDRLYELGLTPYETSASESVDGGHARVRSTVALRTSDEANTRAIIPRRSAIDLTALAGFTTELASLVNSGVAIDDALRIVAGPGSSSAIVKLSNGILNEMIGGSQLSEALARRADAFSSDYQAIVRAGETSGAMGQALQQLADLLARRLEVRRRIVASLVYPLILLGMSMLAIGVIIVFLLPSIAPVFADANLPLPGILAALIALQDNWLRVVFAGVGMLAIVALALRAVRRNSSALLQVDRLKAALPLAGYMIRLREAGRFTRTLGALLKGGVPLLVSLRSALQLVGNSYLAGQYAAAIDLIPEGTALHAALETRDLISAPALRLVAIGEETGQLGSMLLRAAGILENEHFRRIERSLGLLTPLLTVVIGGSVGGLIMTVMSAVLSINELAFQ